METQSKSKIKNILKFLAIVLSGIGLVALLVVGVFFVRNETIIKDDKSVVLADSSGSCGDGVTYTLNELGILTISGTGAMTSHPWTVEAVRDSVKQVVVNNGVTELAYGAFSNCGNLTTANIAASVTSMGAYAFNNCRALKTITLNEGLQSIGNWAFQNCVNLKSITLPETLRTIGDYAFDHCNLITSLYIPKAVYSIGRSIISHCVSLSSLSVDDDNTTYTDSNGNAIIKISDNSLVTMPAGASIPNTVTKIGDFAFVDRTDITEIFIPYGVTSIGDYAFSGCYGLSSITLPSTLTSIGGSAFNYCTDLTSITLPNGLISIGGQAFYHCTGLTSITIPNSVTTISGGAFQECSGLTSIILSNNLESLEDMLFENCSNLTFVTIPSSVTSIGDYVFGYCYDLTSINIPNGVTHIGNGVFYSCYNLTSINIPSSVIQIGNLFGECPRLISITVDNENTVYNDGNGSNKIIETETGIVVAELEYETSGTCGDNLTWTLSNAGVLTISGTGAMTNYLVNSPWNNNQLIKSVVIGNGVTSIGDFAFFECYNLMQVTIPDSVTSIGTHAFASCRSLRSITLSNNILSIGSYAFDSSGLLEIYNYTDLQSSEIDNARTNTYVMAIHTTNEPSIIVTDANGFQFARFRWDTVEYVDGEGYYSNSVEDYYLVGYTGNNTDITLPTSFMYHGNNVTSYRIYSLGYNNSGRPINSLTIPSSVKEICSGVFANFHLKSVTLNGCEYIGQWAFAETPINSLTIGAGVKHILYYAFWNCHYLREVVMPDSVIRINGEAFSGCENLNSITIGSGVTSIGNGTFWGCYGLKSITIDNGNTSYSDGNNHDCLIEISTGKLLKGANNSTIVIPNSVTSIEDKAFQGCNNLKSITIPNTVLSIGNSAFYGCYNLASISIPNSVTNIGTACFEYLTDLKVIIRSTTIPTIGNRTFGGNSSSMVSRILVPQSALSNYRSSWSTYSSIIEGYAPGTEYTILWQNYNGDELEEDLVELGEIPVFRSAAPTRAASAQYNYEWDGWTTPVEIATEDASYVASYNKNPVVYTITYDANDGSSRTLTQNIGYSQEFTTHGNNAFERPGYRLIGWSTDPTSQEGIYSGIDTTYNFEGIENTTLYAMWLEEYTITYILDGGEVETTNPTVYTAIDDEFTLNNPSKSGYDFTGWTGSNGVNPELIVSIPTGTTGNLNYTANWTAVDYYLTYDLNGGSGSITDANAHHITDVVTLTDAEPTKNGYDFNGWKYNNATVTQVTFGADDITVIADWTPIAYTITTTVDGIEAVQNYTVESENITLVNPEKNYYNFEGWTGSNGDEPELEVVIPQGSTGNKEYTANWTAIEYTIAYTLNGGDATNPTVYTVESTAITLNNPSKLGYTFLGWTGSNGEEPSLEVVIPNGSNGNKAYIANWQVITYTIAYTLNGGNATNPTNYTIESDVITLVNPTKVGYNFVGWTGSNGEELSLEVIIPAGSTGNKVYTANFEVITYTIKTIVDSVETTQNYTVESNTITLVNPTKTGYTFLGWTGSNGQEPSLEVIIPAGSTENKEYIANWSEPIVYTITYTLSGGTATNPTTYTVESNSITLVNPTKAGYNFVGWTGSNGDEPSFEVVIPAGSTGNKEYTANWSDLIVYTITYTLNGGEVEVVNPTSYTVESESITLTNPTKLGYTFTGWTGSNGEEPEVEVVIPQGSTGNKEYVANWSINQYTITLHIDGETKVISYNILSENQEIEQPSKKGYTFKGWTGTDLDEATLDVVVPQGSIGNKEYTATWEKNKTSNLALIIGLSVAGGVLLIVIIVLLILAKKKKIKLW